MATFLVILHGLLAVALLGSITHQAIAVVWPARSKSGFVNAYRSVSSRAYVNANIVLFLIVAFLGAYIYPIYRVWVRTYLENARLFPAVGSFEIKEQFIAIGSWVVAALLAGVAASGAREQFGAHRRYADALLLRLVRFSRRPHPKQHPRIFRAMNNNQIEKIIPVFSAAFALIYIVSVELNWAAAHLSSEDWTVGLARRAVPRRSADVLVWLACDLDAWCGSSQRDIVAAVEEQADAVLARVDGSASGYGQRLLSFPRMVSALKSAKTRSTESARSRRANKTATSLHCAILKDAACRHRRLCGARVLVSAVALGRT